MRNPAHHWFANPPAPKDDDIDSEDKISGDVPDGDTATQQLGPEPAPISILPEGESVSLAKHEEDEKESKQDLGK